MQPYSTYRKEGDYVYLSGQLPINLQTGEIVEGGIVEQTQQVMENIQSILQSLHLSMDSLVRMNLYLVNIEDISEVNPIYTRFFPNKLPSRVAVGVQALAKQSLIEIDGIAFCGLASS
ncbi:Rid family detoxifying hydrolase [Streptococcus marmotae]|uniref:Rid family detoxifying hydrolase n=1 Tax=Streptococcus marmotae TaxID=1825069 RepID=UPI0008319ED2|nr:Rid family detoxifying hydrolase [Streptococcus marmotae]